MSFIVFYLFFIEDMGIYLCLLGSKSWFKIFSVLFLYLIVFKVMLMLFCKLKLKYCFMCINLYDGLFLFLLNFFFLF